MNTWKDRLIAYLHTLDGDISPEEAEDLVLEGWNRIKEDFLLNCAL